MSRFDERFEEKYEFRLAKRSDIDDIMKYIDQCWKKGHILAKNRDLFEYEFCDGEEVHFLLAIDRNTGEIEGLDGYYYTSSRRRDFDVWGTMWSVRKDHKNLPMLGVAIANQYFKKIGFRYEIGVGVNKVTATPLHEQHFKVKTGMLKHYYMLHKIKNEYVIASILEPHVTNASSHRDAQKLKKITDGKQVDNLFDFEHKITTYPFKDGWYVRHRFFQHPVYQYDTYAIMQNESEASALVVIRKVKHADHNVLRIVDYMGEIKNLKNVQRQLYELMDDKFTLIIH